MSGLLVGTTLKQIELSTYFLQGDPKEMLRYIETSQLVTGEGYSVSSGTGSFTKTLTFPRYDKWEIDKLRGLLFGALGDEYIYYVDPFAVNLLCLSWGMPYIQANSGSRFDKFADGKKFLTPANDIELPALSLRQHLPGDGHRRTFTFLVPDDCDIAYGIKGSSASEVNFLLTFGDDIALPISDDLSSLYDGVISRDNHSAGRLATLRVNGNGLLELYGMQFTLVNRHATVSSVIREHRNFWRVPAGMAGARVIDTTIGQDEYAFDAPYALKMHEITLQEEEWGKA